MINTYPKYPTAEELAIILTEFEEGNGLDTIPGVQYTILAHSRYREFLEKQLVDGNNVNSHLSLAIGNIEFFKRKLLIMFSDSYADDMQIIALPVNKQPVVKFYIPEAANESLEDDNYEN